MSLAGANDQAVGVELPGGGEAIFFAVPSAPRLVARTGQTMTADGTLIHFDIEAFSINRWGQVALRTFEPFTLGLVAAERSTGLGWDLVLIARGDQPAPGLPGLSFDDFVGRPIINQFEQVAFQANLEGGGFGASNRKGFWIDDPEGGLQLVAREGGTVELAPGDIRTLTEISAPFRGGLEDGWNRIFNLRGELAYEAVFADGSAAIVVAEMPSSALVFLDGFEPGDVSAWSSSIPP